MSGVGDEGDERRPGVFLRVPRERLDDLVEATNSLTISEAVYKLTSEFYYVIKQHYENKELLDLLDEIKFTFQDEQDWHGFRWSFVRVLKQIRRAVKTWVDASDEYLIALYGEDAKQEWVRRRMLDELEKETINLVKLAFKRLKKSKPGVGAK